MEKIIETKETQDSKTLKIDSSLTIQDVALCNDKWKPYQNIKFLTIDASGVKSVDAAGLQLLVHLINNLQTKNGKVEWSPSPSTSFIAQAKLAGMTKVLSLTTGESK